VSEDDCQHLSWECSGAYGDVGPSGSLHQCTECDKKWMSLSEFAKEDQVGVCEICGQPQKDAPKFVTKDSGKREEFDSGMVRDTQDGKPRYDLLLPRGVPYRDQFLTRVAELLARGAEKYSERNWEAATGSSELDRFKSSALRHLMQWMTDESDEDHAAAVVFNLLAYETTKWKMDNGDN
jgi:hypothetical protein